MLSTKDREHNVCIYTNPKTYKGYLYKYRNRFSYFKSLPFTHKHILHIIKAKPLWL